MTDETCNGWANWESWVVNLWLTNDEGIYNETLEICNKDTNPHEYEHKRADQLEEYVDMLMDENIITDKVSLHRVNWKEIMASFQQTIEENKQHEEELKQ